MAERLAARGHVVHLLTYGQGVQQTGRGYRHHRIARLPGDDASRSGPSLVKPMLDALMTARLVTLARAEGLQIVHAHNYEAAVVALAARTFTKVPVVYHSHNLMGDELETYFESAAARTAASMAGTWLDRSVPRRADRVIALCRWSADRLLEAGCDEAALAVIPPAVDDEGPLEVLADDRAFFGLGVEDFVVAYCGNLDAYQNLPLLLRAIGLLRDRPAVAGSSRLRLLLATHADPDGLRGEVAAAGLDEMVRVREVRGAVEARRAVAVADLVALPRRLGSGYPVKLLNYMSAAKAVVSAGCGSKVLRDGVDGVLVPDDDAGALAEAIDRCRLDPERRRDLGQAARRTYLERLTWECVLPQIEDVYAGLERVSPVTLVRS